MTSALITGITGQDGGYLAEHLLADGTTVHGLVRPGEQVPEPLAALDVALHVVDLADDDALRGALRDSGAHEVYNLAGISSVALSWQEPALTAEVNGTLVARLLQLVWEEQERTGSALRFVQASSAEIFAGTTTSPQDESTPLSPRSPYGASKAFAHHLVQVFRERGLHASNAILYNHESPRRPTAFVTRKITSTVAAISEGRADALVLGNLDARRDWGWAPEYVDALVRMARAAAPDDFVVATGQSHTVEDFVAAAFARVGIEDWQRYVSTDPAFVRPVDAVELVGDATRARQVLGWAPQVQFTEVVGRMVDADLAAG
ncbi:MAG: GDP-mannose 4,6 dehydratase [Frankiales bacterium]|nr:GDP-mannose 4,6 dehydratase [Frankiales bacterium]